MTQRIPSETVGYERTVDGMRDTKTRLVSSLKEGVEKATAVCSHWGAGDLAKTVRALSAWMEHARMAVAAAEGRKPVGKLLPITVCIEGGLVQDVTGIPPGYEVHVEDHDEGDTSHPSWNAEKGCFVTVYGGEAA